jgi:hypothetical protein
LVVDLLFEGIHVDNTSNDTAVPSERHGAEASLSNAVLVHIIEISARRIHNSYRTGYKQNLPVVYLCRISLHRLIFDDLLKNGRHDWQRQGAILSSHSRFDVSLMSLLLETGSSLSSQANKAR